MELFTYLMAKNDHNTSVKKDLFSYLLGKNQSGTYTDYSGTSLSINNTKKGKMKVNLLGNTSQYTTTGKNLLHQDQYMTTRTTNNVTFTKNNDGTFNVNGTASVSFTWNILDVGDITLESGKTYYLYSSQPYNSNTFNLSIPYKQDGTQKYLTANNSVTTSGTITDVKLALYIPSGTNVSVTNVKLMLVEGSTAGDYEPYTNGASPNPSYPQQVNVVSGDNTITTSNSDNTQSQTYSINLGEYELCKIGTYQDRFFKNIPNTTDYNSDLEDNEWYLEKKIGKVVLDGSESYAVEQSGGYYRFNITFNDLYYYDGRGTYAISNYYHAQTGNDYGAIITYQSRIMLYPSDTSITTETLFKNWLSTHNTIVYYVLATPTYTPITGTLKDELEAVWRANSYKGTTNINQINNDLPFNLDVEIKVGN